MLLISSRVALSQNAVLQRNSLNFEMQCLQIQSQSNYSISVRFSPLIRQPNKCLLWNMNPDTCEGSSSLAKTNLQDYLRVSVLKSLEDAKPFLEKPFGCGLCGDMLEIQKEFQDHCFSHRFSLPDDLCIGIC